jgi:hypothetical protein
VAAPNEELFAQHAARLRRPLLHAYRYAAPREDLQDIYAQAVLELLLRVRRDSTFNTPRHFAAALELRFKSRIADRHRALGGRSAGAAAFEHAVRLDDPAAAVRGWFDVVSIGKLALGQQRYYEQQVAQGGGRLLLGPWRGAGRVDGRGRRRARPGGRVSARSSTRCSRGAIRGRRGAAAGR